MIVLKPILTAQSFPLTIKGTDAEKLLVRREGLEATTEVAVDSVIVSSNHNVITATFDFLVEGEYYQLIVVEGLNVVCRERIFCTAQDPEDYSPNNNEYIVYE
jgi:hypothetical protein